ncbi:MAG TPA: cupin domain-containing protein [Caldimonas sp.]|nr:cupin domain-containing protein [Caldimonas sp.]
MHVIHHAALPRQADAGCSTRTVAGASVCAAPFVVRTVAIDPGACTAAPAADALVLIALDGTGKLLVDGAPQRFHAPCTLIVPEGASHRVVNDGATPLQLVCVHATGARPDIP